MSARLDQLRRERTASSPVRLSQPFREQHLKHIGESIRTALAARTADPQFQVQCRREATDTRRDCDKLSDLFKRLSPEQAEAVRCVFNREYTILVYQFLLEVAGLINKPEMDRAKGTLNDADLESALASYDQLVHG